MPQPVEELYGSLLSPWKHRFDECATTKQVRVVVRVKDFTLVPLAIKRQDGFFALACFDRVSTLLASNANHQVFCPVGKLYKYLCRILFIPQGSRKLCVTI